jgi:HEAT repeat protein
LEPQFGLFTTDTHLVVRTWDAWLERVTSRPAAEVNGKLLTEIYPEIESRGLIGAFRRVLDDGAVELLAPALHEYLIPCSPQTDGTQFRRMQQRAVIAPLRDGSKITGLVVTIEDVTARRQSELQGRDELADESWRTRREAVERILTQPSETTVTELLRRMRQEHRDPNLLNSVLPLLASGAWETLQPLQDLTCDPDAEVRMYSALALGDLRDRRAIPALLRLLQDGDTNVQYHAIEALAKLRASEAAGPLTEIVQSGGFFLAFPALDALAAIGDPTVAPRLVPLLRDDALRPACVTALSKLGDHSVVEPLVLLMDHPPLVSTVVEALTTLHQRYEYQLGEGEYIAELVNRHITPTGTQNLLHALNTTTGDALRMLVRVLGWVGSERVIGGLTHLLGSASVRSEVIETLVRHGDEVTGPLCRQLESDDLEIRRSAIAALSRIGHPDSVSPLITLLQDPELSVDAAGALARIGDRRAYEPLLCLLAHDRAAVRQAAIAALNSLGDPRMPQDIRHLITDANPHIRESAVRIAGYFGYSDCVALLTDRANDENENVRRAAIESLANFEDESVVPLLRVAIRDDSPKIRTAAAQSLGQLQGVAAVPELIQTLKDSDPWVRYYVLQVLGQIRSPESVDAVAGVLREDKAPQVRIAAAEALGSIGGRRIVSILAPYVGSENCDLARAALLALGAVAHPDALDPILNALRSDDSSRRLDAVRAIAARRDNEAAEMLQWTAAADPSEEVAERAIEELAKIATAESVSALLRLASDRRLREKAITGISRLGPKHLQHIKAGLFSPQLETRRAAVEVLGRMKHPEASEALRTALDDDRPEVRLAALLALRRLGSVISGRKVWTMAYNDPDPGVREAAEKALDQR